MKSLMSILSVLGLLLFAGNVMAGQCVVGQVKEVGAWANPDQNTRGITRAIFGEECRDDTRTVCNGDICRTTFGVKLVYTTQLWGSCSPRDCYWGKVEGHNSASNWLRFNYDQGYAKRDVWAKIWSGGDNWLRLYIKTDFVSPSRADYVSDVWMQRR